MKKKIIHIIKHLVYLLAIGALAVPALQAHFQWKEEKPLYGGFVSEPAPSLDSLSLESWMDGRFQKQYSAGIEQHFGWRPYFVRLNNQINFSIYGITDNPNIVIGKNNCLYEEGYILAYLGRNFIGKELINERMRRVKWVQDYLKKEKNIDLIVVFEPGKGSYHAENIPDRYRPWDKQLSNYDYFVQCCKESDIRYIDFNRYFLLMKDTTAYPLIPNYGVHWGTYGMVVAADSLIKYIEQIRGTDLPDFDWSQITVTNQKKDVDFDWDAEQTLNLLYRLPFAPMAYPEIKFIQDSTKKPIPALCVADSYYWNFYNSGIPQHCFKDHQFWYYYYQIYPYIWDDSHLVSALDAKQEVEKQEVILLMATEMNLYRAFWQFTDDLYRWYCPDYRENSFYDKQNEVIYKDHWLREVMREANQKKVSPEEVIKSKARSAR